MKYNVFHDNSAQNSNYVIVYQINVRNQKTGLDLKPRFVHQSICRFYDFSNFPHITVQLALTSVTKNVSFTSVLNLPSEFISIFIRM